MSKKPRSAAQKAATLKMRTAATLKMKMRAASKRSKRGSITKARRKRLVELRKLYENRRAKSAQRRFEVNERRIILNHSRPLYTQAELDAVTKSLSK